ncbi:polycystic kidney disease protein 1-like 2 [Takifugu flavidus]|uniref:polycystic kidney disease protein 1-like 2 n=1 Tax=Takifugu flavidus TaxID=433684 RepID=UPI0025445D8C|nr:polycystic kidney disease protein 1-like 2 [Takifugu flavidus]XP_056899472.1 polycystic kidney disease protein 1-like 2 [Takifugu flavidus]
MILLVRSAAALYDDVAINVRWLLLSRGGNFSCKLSTGDGRVFSLKSPEALEIRVLHRYVRPGTFAVAAQKVISIRRPVTAVSFLTCYAGNLSFSASNCKAVHGERLQIQINAGSKMTYRIQIDDILLPGFCSSRGNVPVNITVAPDIVNRLRIGCQRLIIYASNVVKVPGVSAQLQICVLEKIRGLRASVLADKEANLKLGRIVYIGVSLEQGVPALLLFRLLQNNDTISKSTEIKTNKAIFHLGHHFHGCMKIKLKAWNIFSSVEIDVDMPTACSKDTDIKELKKQIRFARSEPTLSIVATPGNIIRLKTDITLSVTSSDTLTDSSKRYKWECKHPCKCQDNSEGTTHVVGQSCLPQPYEYITYRFSVINIADNNVEESEFICITVIPTKATVPAQLTCTQGCNPVTENKAATIKLDCINCNIDWYITELSDSDNWPDETRSCYINAGERPFRKVQDGGTQYIVSGDMISQAMEKGVDIRVVVIYDANVPLYKDYTINTRVTDSTATTTHPTTPRPTSQSPGDNNGVLTTSIRAGSSTSPTTPRPTSQNNGVLTTSIRAGSSRSPTTPRPTSQNNGVLTTSIRAGSSRSPTTPRPTSQNNGVLTTSIRAGSSTSPTTPRPTSQNNGVLTTSIRAGSSTSPTTPHPTSQNNGVLTTSIRAGSSTSPTTPRPTSQNNGVLTTSIGAGSSTSPTAPRPTSRSPGDNNDIQTTSVGPLQCTIAPLSGTNIDAFNITCNTAFTCSNCQYCFHTLNGNHLQCSNDREVVSLFLPPGNKQSNFSLHIAATAKSGSFVASTIITTQVLDFLTDSGSSDDDLVKNITAKLKKQGQLSGETVAQIFAVSDNLNNQSSNADRRKLRQLLLQVMKTTVKEVPINTPTGVHQAARALNAITQRGSELGSSAVEEASVILANLSTILLHVEVNNSEEIVVAAKTIVEGASNILEYTYIRNISDDILVALKNTQRALLRHKNVNQGPVVIKEDNINMLVDRVTPDYLHRKSIQIPNCSCFTFSLPKLPSTLIPPGEPVDVQMLTLDKNPFVWNERGNISGRVGALSLAAQDGSFITVENLSKDIEILMPSPAGTRVSSSILDLGNYSTMVIDLPSADSTVLLKMVPSVDPLPFKVFLGYKSYPTDTDFVAMTEMPLKGANLEERYTWMLQPKDLKGCMGEHYLVVRPVVGAGVKSINASLTVTSITTACNFWNESNLDWSTYGCRVGVQTTHLVTQCLCNHLTFFGSSFFVTPNLVDPSRSAELFGTFVENPVVVCFVGALFVVYFLVLVWARRKDIQDVAKVKITVLQDNHPLDEYSYLLSVSTGHRRGASTSSQVVVTLLGADGNSEPHHLTDPKKQVFERGAVDVFLLTTSFSLGDLNAVRLWHNNSGSHPAWFVGTVVVQDLQTGQKWHFLCNTWLAIDIGDCLPDRVFPVSSEMDLMRFSNLFFMKASKDFSDGHLWYSVISRPPSSTFTRVQRVSCCFSLLLCTMLTSIMFYGIPSDPSEQTMDLGHFEFTWQQFMIGVQSSLIMFPINILIVSIFRHTQPRKPCCCKCKRETPDVPGRTCFSQADTQAANENVTLETVMKDISRIAHSLSKTVKSSIPCTEFVLEQQIDINAVLSVVEGFIKLGSNTKPQLPGGSLAAEALQMKSNKSQYLYQQLSCIERDLTLLGPSSFHSPHSYSQAMQQVKGMTTFLEDQISKFSHFDLAEPIKNQGGLADATTEGGCQSKSNCCHGGFPWWFVFFGWLIVIATSVVAGYFTMIYGLKFGKERSISWLISMVVSFFQSILVIQPLKVVFLAVFFALIIKKVDEEDYQHMVVVETDSHPGGDKDPQTVRPRSGVYQPPAPADIEKMRKNKILEEKAFAFLKEFLIHVGFMWMLLLVAYGQRDPNAYFLQKHIRESFSNDVSDSMSLGDVFSWSSTVLLKNLFGEYSGFITDGNSKLVGNARIRQLRVQRNSCQVAGSMQQLVPGCHAPYSWEVEDTGSYGPGWNCSTRNYTTSTPNPWKYQTRAELRAYPVWGDVAVYGGGGFAAELGPDLQNANRTITYLFKKKWLDGYTRTIFVEFTVYNANINLFCIVTLLLENTAIGAFQFVSNLQTVRLYQSTGGLHVFVMAAEIIYMVFILYYMFIQVKLLKTLRWLYFTSKWNLFELAVIVLSWSAVAVFIKRTLIGNRDITHYRNHRDQFASFYESAVADSTLQYLIAFLVLLTTLKLWRLLRLNPKMNIFTATLQRAWSDITGFLLIIAIMFAAYSIVSNMMYGWQISSYRTVSRALLTIISLQIGIFNYDEVLNGHPLLGGFLFGSCIMFMSFMVLNLLISVILAAFSNEQVYHKPSDDEEIFDLMLRKVCNLLGIKSRSADETQLPNENVGSFQSISD